MKMIMADGMSTWWQTTAIILWGTSQKKNRAVLKNSRHFLNQYSSKPKKHSNFVWQKTCVDTNLHTNRTFLARSRQCLKNKRRNGSGTRPTVTWLLLIDSYVLLSLTLVDTLRFWHLIATLDGSCFFCKAPLVFSGDKQMLLWQNVENVLIISSPFCPA